MNPIHIVAATTLALVALTPTNARVHFMAPSAPGLTLFNTGVDASGVSTTGNGADLHWTLGAGSAQNGGTNGVFPIGPWLAEDATSRWATPTNNATDDVGVGSFAFTETFTLAAGDVATAGFFGRYAVDNAITSIKLNGVALANSGGSFTSWRSFSSAGGVFQAGTNTLTFDTQNFGGPAGVRVEFTGTAVPEASTWAMMLAGFAMVGFSVRRRSSTVTA